MKFQRSAAAAAVVCVLSLLLSSGVRAADSMDGRRYEAWAKFKVGSSETLAGSMEVSGMQATSELVEKLTDLTPERATVEMTTTVNMMGRTHTAPPRHTEIPAKGDKVEAKDLGKESVEAMGRKFDCQVYEVSGEGAAPPPPGPGGRPSADDQKRSAKIWVSPEVPGGLVKMEMKGHGQQGGEVTITYLLKAFDAK